MDEQKTNLPPGSSNPKKLAGPLRFDEALLFFFLSFFFTIVGKMCHVDCFYAESSAFSTRPSRLPPSRYAFPGLPLSNAQAHAI